MANLKRSLTSILLPAAVLVLARVLLPIVPALPPSLAGLQTYSAAILLVIAGAVGVSFGRARVLLAALVLGAAYATYLVFLKNGLRAPVDRTAFAGLWLFVPLDIAALALLRERGIFNRYGLQRIAVLCAQVGLVTWIILAPQRGLMDHAYAPVVRAGLLPGFPIPDIGLAVIAAAMMAGAGAWWRTRSPVDMGLLGALVSFVAAAGALTVPHAFPLYMAAGGLILAIAVLQDSFHMAFRDGLTGLPSRRALEERLAGLDRHYTLAMVDVDHFKRFNDTYGHDLGDQVLKVVAGWLSAVGGGGTAYRYGGEEFTVLFPSRTVAETLPHLDAMRQQIASHGIALRAADRPRKARSGRKRRGSGGGAKTVSVAVSIGVAERSDRLDTPAAVIVAADRALYRAKNRGRNQVSR